MSGSPRFSRCAGWMALVAMVANLCVAMTTVSTATASDSETPTCCCGDGCACGPGCLCSVSPADPSESRPEVPAPAAPAMKLIPLAMPRPGVERLATVASDLDRPRPATSARPVDRGQREIRLRTGICTT